MTSSRTDVPSGWVEGRFTDLAVRESKGQTPKAPKSIYQTKGTFPVVDQGQEMVAGFVDDDDLQFHGRLPVIVFGDHTRIFKYVDFPFVAGADGTRIITPLSDRVDVSFFYYVLCNLPLTNLGYSRHFKLLKEQVVQFPENLCEQRKIAAILSSVDDAIEKARAVIDQVQVVKRALMQELLTRGLPGRHTRFKQTEIGEIPEGWNFVSLADLAESGIGLQTGPFGSQLHASDYVAHGVPVIMPKDITNGYVSDAYSARISDERAEELRRHRVYAGDILFARRGDLGRAGLITQHEDGWLCGTGCFKFRPKNRTASRFLWHWVRWPASVRWLNEHAVGQTMLNLNTSILGRLPVALPPEAEQSAIADVIEALSEQTETLEREQQQAGRLKAGLMSVLLTGKLRVTPDIEAA